jgi:hypothetical protein
MKEVDAVSISVGKKKVTLALFFIPSYDVCSLYNPFSSNFFRDFAPLLFLFASTLRTHHKAGTKGIDGWALWM